MALLQRYRSWSWLGSVTLILLVSSMLIGTTAASAAPSGASAWGVNFEGQLGDGTSGGPEWCGGSFPDPCSTVPLAVNSLGNAKSVAAGQDHGVALLNDATVVDWGGNSRGELGDGIDTGPETCETWFIDGPLESLPCSRTPVAVSGLSEVTAIAAGSKDSLALLADGKVMAWGGNEYGQLGNGTNTDSNVPVEVSGLSEVTAIAAGGHHGLALLRDGKVMAWGENTWGQLGDGTSTDSNVPVEVSGLSEVTAIAAGAAGSIALLGDGTVACWGRNISSDVPVRVSGINEATAVATSGNHSLALLANGKVMAWGNNGSGQLGDGTTTASAIPVEVSGLSDVAAIAAGNRYYSEGNSYSLALLRDGKVMAWGGNSEGQLGNGASTDSDVPVWVDRLSNVTSIAAGYGLSLAIGTLSSLPSVTSLNPASGPAGTSVTITGTGLRRASAVMFGSAEVRPTDLLVQTLWVHSDTEITAVAPPGSGTVDVTVRTLEGTSATNSADRFTYDPSESSRASIELVSCKAVKRAALKGAHRQRRAIKATSQICTSKLVSGSVRTGALKASLRRGDALYGTGTATASDTKTRLALKPLRRVKPGRYRLTLIRGRSQRHEMIAIR